MPIENVPLRWARTFVLAGIVFFALAENAVSLAGEPEPAPAPYANPAASMPAAEPAPASEPVPTGGYLQAIGKKMDEAHAALERNILEQTIRFDNFFGEAKTENLRPLRYEIRWRNSFRIEHGWDFKYGPSIRANFALSKINERLRLVIAGEGGPRPATQSLPQDPGNPGFDRTTPTTHFANTELRYELIQNPSLDLFLGTGVQFKLPFEAFVRSHLEYTRHLSDVSLFHFAETFFVKNTDLLGETTEITLERSCGPRTIIRWASTGTASQEIDGLEWGSELSLIRQLSPKSAVTLTSGIYGNTTASAMVQNYRLFARYRRNFLRSWLFYELEPEISWPKDVDGSYPATLAITFRLEVVFKGAAMRSDKTPGTN